MELFCEENFYNEKIFVVLHFCCELQLLSVCSSDTQVNALDIICELATGRSIAKLPIQNQILFHSIPLLCDNYCRLELFCAEKYLRKFITTIIAVEIFCDHTFCDFEYWQIFAKTFHCK